MTVASPDLPQDLCNCQKKADKTFKTRDVFSRSQSVLEKDVTRENWKIGKKLSFHHTVAENLNDVVNTLFEVYFTVISCCQWHFQSFNSRGNCDCGKRQVINFENIFANPFNQYPFNHPDFFLLMTVFDVFDELDSRHIVFKGIVKICHTPESCQLSENVISQFINRIGIAVHNNFEFFSK